MDISQDRNKITGRKVCFLKGTKNYFTYSFYGTIKKGKIKIIGDKIVKSYYPDETKSPFICLRNLKGRLKVDAANRLMTLETSFYGMSNKYDIENKEYAENHCSPTIGQVIFTKRIDGIQFIKKDTTNVINKKEQIVSLGKKEIKVFTKSVKIKVWDHLQEDGDIVNIYLNNQLLFSHVKVSKKGEVFNMKLQSGENIIQVKALNEGRNSPNTSAIKVIVNNEEHQIILSARKGQRDSLKIMVE
ncbi:hypothetical protein DDD_2674 [Nonlabens dokdonensis DSW-6]|uniref:Uncharacterized protein n=2 Tax=Nonlabens dokdonensis TaxID=328515 RepID=L7WD19_NONDD|nr:hypothetical protein DDD_2674 [Nonlabens dokdonensis DSW-6]